MKFACFFLLCLCFGFSLRAAEAVPRLSQERIVFRTNVGDMIVALYPDIAPQHTAQILQLARLGVFDGTAIFRIEPGFVAQTDNYDRRTPPLTDQQFRAVVKIPAEFSSIEHRRGLLSMARQDDVDSAEASFSFMLGKAPHLDGQYTVFGEVVAGLDVLDKIEEQPVNENHVPQNLLEITKAEVIENGDVSAIHINSAHDYEAPYEVVRKFFLAFAFGAFALTILLPIIKTAFEKNKKSKN